MKVIKRILFAGLLALIASPAQAAGVLATDTSSFGPWNGSTPFQGLDLSNNPTDFHGDIEWAVYAPGNFPGTFSGYVPTPGEFVYAYQAFVNDAALSQVTIRLTDQANNIGSFTGPGISGDAPIDVFINPTFSASWYFDGVPGGGTTRGLAFSSPHGPAAFTGSAVNHGSSAIYFPVPSPDPLAPTIPEPGSAALALAGLAGLSLYRWTRFRPAAGASTTTRDMLRLGR